MDEKLTAEQVEIGQILLKNYDVGPVSLQTIRDIHGNRPTLADAIWGMISSGVVVEDANRRSHYVLTREGKHAVTHAMAEALQAGDTPRGRRKREGTEA